jgi:WD40 repeat protein
MMAQLPFKEHESRVLSVVAIAEGSRVVSGGRDGTVRVLDAASSAAVGERLRGHEGDANFGGGRRRCDVRRVGRQRRDDARL